MPAGGRNWPTWLRPSTSVTQSTSNVLWDEWTHLAIPGPGIIVLTWDRQWDTGITLLWYCQSAIRFKYISSWLFILFYPVHYFNCSESVNYLPPMATVNFICYYKHWLLMATGQSLQWCVRADQLQVLFPEQAKCYAEHAQQQKIYDSGNKPSTWHILTHRSFISLKSKLFNHNLAEKWQ